jgi:hypothetical protein
MVPFAVLFEGGAWHLPWVLASGPSERCSLAGLEQDVAGAGW